MKIEIDVTDWEDETKRNERTLENDDEILEMVSDGLHTAEIARAAIISRELGIAKPEILPPCKLLLQSGAMVDISARVARQKHKVTTASGAEFESRSFVGSVATDDGKTDAGQAYVKAHAAEAITRAEQYLERVVPGHIWNRLLLIYENQGDVKLSAAKLKAAVDEMVARLE